MTLVARETRAETARRRSVQWSRWLEAYAFVGLLVVAAVFFMLLPATADTFPSAANIRTLISGNSVLAVIALAALVPLVAGEFDLSVGAVAGASSIFAADYLVGGGSVVVGIGIGLGIGVVVGVVNALLVTQARVNAVIATLGVSILLAGVINQKTSGQSISGAMDPGFLDFGSSTFLGLPNLAFALIAVTLLVYYVLGHTPYGRHLHAYGSNRAAARLVGIRTNLTLGVSFVVSGALAGAAGVLQVARAGGADPRVGDTFTLPALAAAFLSAAAIDPGRYNVGGTLVAIFFLATLNSGLNLAGAAPYVNSYVNGAALIAGVALAVALGRRRDT